MDVIGDKEHRGKGTGRAFVWSVLLGTFASLLFISLVVVSQDPRGQFKWLLLAPNDPGEQLALEMFSRVHKPLRLLAYDPDVVILGTSRAEIGLNPSDEVWGSMRAYNFALSGGSPEEIRKAGELAVALGAKRLIVTIDFPQFVREWRQGAMLASPWQSELEPTLRYWTESWFAQLFSRTSLRDCFCRGSHSGLEDATIGADGMQLPLTHLSLRRRSEDLQTYYFSAEAPYWDLWRAFTSDGQRLAAEQRLTSGMQEIAALLNFAASQSIRVDLVILPAHPFHWQVLYASGQSQMWEIWKLALGRLPAHVAITDFTLAEGIWTSTPEQLDNLFVDPSHMSPALGKEVLRHVLARSDAAPRFAPIRLAPKDVARELGGWERLLSNGHMEADVRTIEERFRRGNLRRFPFTKDNVPALCFFLTLG